GTIGALLFTLAVREQNLHLPQLGAASLTRDSLLLALFLLAVLAGYALFSKRDALNRLFDVVLPLLAGLLLVGTIWGLPAAAQKAAWLQRLLEQHEVLQSILPIAIPAVFCIALARRPIQFGLAVGLMFFVGGLRAAMDPDVIHRERSFYGAMHITSTQGGTYHTLIHGNINHGMQHMRDSDQLTAELLVPLAAAYRPMDVLLSAAARQQTWAESHYPVAYFHPSTPYGQLFLSFRGDHAKQNIAILGLGTGGLAGYAIPGQKWTYFELNPAVEKIARNPRYFTFLTDCEKRGVNVRVILGDGRLQLKKLPLEREEDKFD